MNPMIPLKQASYNPMVRMLLLALNISIAIGFLYTVMPLVWHVMGLFYSKPNPSPIAMPLVVAMILYHCLKDTLKIKLTIGTLIFSIGYLSILYFYFASKPLPPEIVFSIVGAVVALFAFGIRRFILISENASQSILAIHNHKPNGDA